ncbi:MAG: hypothetical protein ACYC4L_17985 [Chloroflexota bacterium]
MKNEAKVKAGRARAQAFTHEYQSRAGKAGYQARQAQLIALHWPHADRAAQAITGLYRLTCGFTRARGMTAAAVVVIASALGYDPAEAIS